ncbi:MAG: metallophosphoesterase [Proteobacteria bacterium]|nr:metallophosphoesterase [Pseudomonadota bacterium]
MNSRITIVIADSHLGVKEEDISHIRDFISELVPSNTEILFLGDLFHIWAGPQKFHTAQIKQFLELLQIYRDKGGKCYLVTGNRDVFIKETNNRLPFDRIATESLVLEKPGGKLMAVHGDTINSLDLKYLKWRRTIRNPLFQLPFQLIPSSWAKKIMFALERRLKQTNIAFRHSFPTEEWLKFLHAINKILAPDLLLAGHFHPSSLVVDEAGSTTGLVLPDWCDNHYYLEIDENLAFREKTFS